MSTELLTNQDIDLYLRLFPRYKVAFLLETLAEYSPGENRAFEVASRKAQHKREQGIYRVQLDRTRAYARAFDDRGRDADTERARLARQGVLRTLRPLAGRKRRTGSPGSALRVYGCDLVLNAFPAMRPARALSWFGLNRPQTPRRPAHTRLSAKGDTAPS